MTTHPLTIQEVLERIYAAIGGNLAGQKVDNVKSGDPGQPVRGIVTCFLATAEVLTRAAELGANLVITHEPTFYDHLDDTAWLEGDPVLAAKKAFLEQHGLVVWRFHDGMHGLQKPDGIVAGVMEKLGWEPTETPSVYAVPPQTVGELAEACKRQLGIPCLRMAGPRDAVCRKIGLKVGAYGGHAQITLFKNHDVDVVVCGETSDWETCEYVRDANAFGKAKALIVLGHCNSEQPGMEWLVPWLRPLVPAEIPVTHIPTGDPFRFV